MKKLIVLFLILLIVCDSWAVPKPMESLTNYNVMLLHGAYGHYKKDKNGEIDKSKPQGFFESDTISSANDAENYLGNATIGRYTEKADDTKRINHWLSKEIFEEPEWASDSQGVHNSYIYHWRAFSSPPNSSITNAEELGDRQWNAAVNGSSKFGKRRALVEEAQEVKASVYDSIEKKYIYGQEALDSIRRNPDLYRQLASRYILIGHSMGGVVAREYTQNSDYYHGDVDKIITLDSPHEGTGALEMQLDMVGHKWEALQGTVSYLAGLSLLYLNMRGDFMAKAVAISSASWATLLGITNFVAPFFVEWNLQDYSEDDPLVKYVNPGNGETGNISYLKGIPANDSLPMFRLMGGEKSITYSDPFKDVTDWTGLFVPEGLTQAFMNFFSQMGESDDMMSTEAFALASKAATMGLVVSAAAREQGTSIVPKSSSWAANTLSLEEGAADVKRWRFDAAPHDDADAWRVANTVMSSVALACIAIDVSLSWFEGARIAANVATIAGSSIALSNMLASLLSEDLIAEISDSHNLPIDNVYDNQATWHAGYSNAISSVGGSSVNDTTINPLIMEDFLYEKPFVNLALSDSRTMDSLSKMGESAREKSTLNRNCFYGVDVNDMTQFCEIGLYDGNGASFRKRNYAEFRNSPMKFHSSSDWSSIGVKMDRWERVDGLTPDGDPAPKSVPIRHVERYNVPAITVDDWIEKYSFVVDDLMPHRLRQIRMNFNYQDEIAWECDITKPENATDACEVFKRSAGGTWGHVKWVKDSVDDGKGGKVARYDSLKTVPHPVKKNGQFDFEPRKYGYNNLLAIQKDNQNTVTISTVNKIGLSNTQRLYYLFKATDNLLKSNWPVRDAVLNKVDGFDAFVSVLDYQGFKVDSASDIIYVGGDIGTGTRKKMIGTPDGIRDMNFCSQQSISSLFDGSHEWQLRAYISDSSGNIDTTGLFNVSFEIDRQAPLFDIYVDNSFVNPDSVPFIARFVWQDSAHTPDIHALRWILEKSNEPNGADFKKVKELAAMYNISSKDFAVPWSDSIRELIAESGLYRVSTFAVDYAVPNRAAYDSVNALISKIMADPKALGDDDWKFVENSSSGLNVTTRNAYFRVDRDAPVMKIKELSLETLKKTDSLDRPAQQFGVRYLNGEELLKISYSVNDECGGCDSSKISILWNFIHAADTSKIERAGDSIVVNGNSVSGIWNEYENMRLSDGDYRLRADLRDLAGNKNSARVGELLRVDRTSPNILSLVSSKLVYPDSVKDYRASVVVNEKNDIESNRMGMFCQYRILGGDGDSSWREIRKNDSILLLKADTIQFAIDESAVGINHGLRYLNVGCADVAGNEAYRTDMFYIGERVPLISYPVLNVSESSNPIIPIVGIAPPSSLKESSSTRYRLRYRSCGDSVWKEEGIETISSNQSKDKNISKIGQSNEGILGYLHNDFVDSDEKVCIELGVQSCMSCDWKTVETSIVLKKPDTTSINGNGPIVKLDVSEESLTVGKDSVQVSLHLDGYFEESYMLHLYGEDETSKGLFDYSVANIQRNPYYGVPSDSVLAANERGVWFYQDDNLAYHLKWKGLPNFSRFHIHYDSKTLEKTCGGPGDYEMDYNCRVEYRPIGLENSLFPFDNGLSPELILPTFTDSVMVVYGEKGHLVFQSKGAFRIAVENNESIDSTEIQMPVFFGDSRQDGFYWIPEMNTPVTSPFAIGWNVNPQLYGLSFVWNGTSVTGTYPSGSLARLTAEITENTKDSPYVKVVNKSIVLKRDALKIALDEKIPDYIMLKKSTNECSVLSEDCEMAVYSLDSMKIFYGIKNWDANVDVYVINSNKEVVGHKFFADLKANKNDSAYSYSWFNNGLNRLPKTDSSETYTIKILAVASDDSTQKDSTTSEFNVIYANSMVNMTPASPQTAGTPSVYVSEAVWDSNYSSFRYEPIADYLVQADVEGWYLPDSLQGTLQYTAEPSGSQIPLAFDAERFSLGILRQRDSIDLVIFVVFDAKLDENGCDSGSPTYDGERHLFYRKKLVHFYKNKTVLDTLIFHESVGSIEDGRAFSVNENSILNVYAFPAYMKDSTDESLSKDTMNAFAHFSYVMPKPTRNHSNDVSDEWGALQDTVNVGCHADSLKDCNYGAENYNPEAKLFKLKIDPQNEECTLIHNGGAVKVMSWNYLGLEQCPIHNTYYYYNLGQVRNGAHCYNNDKGFEDIIFTLSLEIPEFYWNAGFGYDNLVNKTIRFDPTNTTIYGESSGYMKVLENQMESGFLKDSKRRGYSYYDGTKWKHSNTYGRLTPFETQHLPFFTSRELTGSDNIFLFPDEISGYGKPSKFSMKFYAKDKTSHFVADVFGKDIKGNSYHRQLTSLNKNFDTDLLQHGGVDFFVSYNKVVAELETKADSLKVSYLFPAPIGKIPAGNDSLKYYRAASRIHYYVGDYDDTLWRQRYVTLPYFRNLSSLSNYTNLLDAKLPYSPDSISALGISKDVESKVRKNGEFRLQSNDYNNQKHSFYHTTGLEDLGAPSLNYKWKFTLKGVDTSLYKSSKDSIYINAQQLKSKIYRKSMDSLSLLPTKKTSASVAKESLYVGQLPWVKNFKINSAQVTYLDSSEHTHFAIGTQMPTESNVDIEYKKDINQRRLKEFVEVRGYLEANKVYRLAYLKDGVYYSVLDSVRVESSGNHRITWFNTNRLQGNTQFLLTWGDAASNYYYITFDMVVGAGINTETDNIVHSALKDVTVSFPQGSFPNGENITVRTANAQDYGLDVYEDMAIVGPIVEVLPSYDFGVGPYPRIQTRISKEEMTRNGITPQALRLYKVDFVNRKFVPLEDALYGYLDADEKPLVNDDADGNVKMCPSPLDKSCGGMGDDWEYMLISAETRTFSVFVAMDSVITDSLNRISPVDTLPAEFACVVPRDSLWLGLDNGYMAYGASCNHPGVGMVSLYRDGGLVAEIHGNTPDTIVYDGTRSLGLSPVGKIPTGVYESRYLGISTLGFEQQIAGPLVYTDSLRPVVEGFTVQESSDVLDRIFTVSARVADSESGLASVSLSPVFGGISLRELELTPDSSGTVNATFRLTREELSGCMGCKLRMAFRAEDFGHNHADTTYVSDRLYPYPATLALWYPAREGTGAKAYEFLNGEHDLELSSVQNPWQSDAGIYFGKESDHAVGSGRVDLGTTDSYTLEFRMKRGNAPDVWRDIISFTGPGNLSIRLLQKGRSLSLSEGGREWISGDVLPALTKSWVHVAVVSDADGVRFYVDGTPVKFVPGGISADRELYGSLSLGSSSGNSFVGNIADVRFYTGALTGSEIAYLSMPATDNGNLSNVIVVSVKDVNVMNGFSGQFSCAVAGNRYLEAGGDASRLRMNVFVEKAGDYQVVVYARSANLSSAEVSVGEGTVVSGTLALSGVWRASALSGAALHLSRGTHSILLEAPTGVQIGGIALSEATISPAMVAWGRGLTGMDMEAQSPSKIQTSLKYEGFLDRSMLRPRIRLKNISDETINGYSVRYYFRGEDPTQVQTSAFFPQNSVDLQIHSESARTGYAEWDFNGFVLAPNDSAFYGEGPHFGLYNADWSPWNAEDDPSFVTAAMDGYAVDEGIVVLDRDNNLIGGRCVEMEDEASIVVKPRVLASDTRNDNQASEIHFTVENLGNTALRDFEVRYYFHVEEGLAPIMDINYLSACSTAELESLGSGRFQVRVRCRGSIGAGNAMNDPVNISLHLSGWANIWNSSDDPGHVGLSTSMAEARGICVFDSLGNRIYGDDPSWPETSIVAGTSNGNPETLDNGYHGDVSIPIVRTEDGLVLSLDSWTTLSLDLVNAIGIPVKSIFNGTLQPGEQLVAVDWTGINPRTTYLVLKINGTIKATKLLSLL